MIIKEMKITISEVFPIRKRSDLTISETKIIRKGAFLIGKTSDLMGKPPEIIGKETDLINKRTNPELSRRMNDARLRACKLAAELYLVERKINTTG